MENESGVDESFTLNARRLNTSEAALPCSFSNRYYYTSLTH